MPTATVLQLVCDKFGVSEAGPIIGAVSQQSDEQLMTALILVLSELATVKDELKIVRGEVEKLLQGQGQG